MGGFVRTWGLVLGLALLGTAAAAQHAEQTRESAPAPEKEWVEVIDHSEEGELDIVIGPIVLEAGASHHSVKQPPLLTVTVPAGGYLYGFDIQMVNGDGAPITNDVLHHVNLIDPDHRELFSPISRRLFAAGKETQPAAMPKFLGIPLDEGQRLNISAMFHNPSGEPYPDAHLRVTLKYRQEGMIFPVAVHPVYIDVMGFIGEKDFDLPPGTYEQSWEGSPAISGRLLGAGGHLHERATALRFEDLTTGDVLWEVVPVVDEDGHLLEVPMGKFWWKGGIRLHADHTYRLTAAYDNPTGETLVDGGMGVLGGIFLPARGEEWPAVDEVDPEYLTDLERTFQTALRRSMGMDDTHGGPSHSH